MAQAGDFAACRIVMDDALLSRTHDHRFGFLQRRQCLGAVAGRDCLLDLAYEGPHLGASRLVDLGAAGDLAGGFAGRGGIGHGPCLDGAAADPFPSVDRYRGLVREIAKMRAAG